MFEHVTKIKHVMSSPSRKFIFYISHSVIFFAVWIDMGNEIDVTWQRHLSDAEIDYARQTWRLIMALLSRFSSWRFPQSSQAVAGILHLKFRGLVISVRSCCARKVVNCLPSFHWLTLSSSGSLLMHFSNDCSRFAVGAAQHHWRV